MSSRQTAIVKLIASMVIFGTIGIFRRFIPIGSAALAMCRGFIGMLFLLALLYLREKRKADASAVKAGVAASEAGASDHPIRRQLPLLIVSGVALGFNWILLFEAYNYTTVAVATLCYYMAPIFILLVSPVLLKEALTKRKIVCVVLAFIGMILVSGVLHGGDGSTNMKGILFGLGAAVLYATVVLLNRMIKGVPAFERTIVQLATTAFVLLPYVLLTDRPDASVLTPAVIGLILFVGIVHTGIAYALYFGAFEQVSAQTAALFSYIDPIVAILLSALVLAEPMGAPEIIGTVLILGATIANEFQPSEK